jgi:hypothetical protein
MGRYWAIRLRRVNRGKWAERAAVQPEEGPARQRRALFFRLPRRAHLPLNASRYFLNQPINRQ